MSRHDDGDTIALGRGTGQAAGGKVTLSGAFLRVSRRRTKHDFDKLGCGSAERVQRNAMTAIIERGACWFFMITIVYASATMAYV